MTIMINAWFIPLIIVLTIAFTHFGSWGTPLGWAVAFSIIILLEESGFEKENKQ